MASAVAAVSKLKTIKLKQSQTVPYCTVQWTDKSLCRQQAFDHARFSVYMYDSGGAWAVDFPSIFAHSFQTFFRISSKSCFFEPEF